jgi:uncharacterized membrane protein YvbJ
MYQDGGENAQKRQDLAMICQMLRAMGVQISVAGHKKLLQNQHEDKVFKNNNNNIKIKIIIIITIMIIMIIMIIIYKHSTNHLIETRAFLGM